MARPHWLRAPHQVLGALLPLGLAGLLAACGGETPSVPPPPPVTPTSTWDLTPQGPLPPALSDTVTPDGVRVLVLARGDGPPPTPTEMLDVRIEGRLRNGSTFTRMTQRYKRSPNDSEGLRVKGFAAALDGIREGERRLVLIPHPLGYGPNPPWAPIPPHADLVFDVTRLRLRTQDLVVGVGAEAQEGQAVLVHYRGTLEDGTVFDDSRTNNKGVPLQLVLRSPRNGQAGVIEGWVKGIPGMRVGGTRRIEIPSTMAYGERGSPNGKVPPHADLTFVVELFGLPTDEAPAR